jgi:hypothetical protein
LKQKKPRISPGFFRESAYRLSTIFVSEHKIREAVANASSAAAKHLHDDFLVIGAYPPAGTYDECTTAEAPPPRPQDHPEGRIAAQGSRLRDRRATVETLEES